MKRISVCLYVCLLFSVPAVAGLDNPFAYFQVYSADSIGTATQAYGSDFQGTAGAGGDVYFAGFSANTFLKNDFCLHVGGSAFLGSGSYYKDVEVGNNLYMQSFNIDGDVYIGGDATGISGGSITGDLNAAGLIDLPGSITVTGDINPGRTYTPVVDHSAVKNYFSSVSDYYAGQADTTGYVNRYGGLEITLTSGMNIVSMTADEFKNAWGLAVSGPADSALIINLTGEAAVLDSINLNGIDKSKVLLNYVNAATLNITGGTTLNILAINADTYFPYGHVDGNLIVGNLTGSGQVNDGYFNPCTPIMPEPATLVILGLGGLLIRRRS